MKTLAAEASWEEEIKRSRFLVHAARVRTLDETLAFHERIKRDDANHNCWAFRLGQTYRFFDDGEPSSSAGRPILAAIDGQGLDEVMVVVTRYFGGIKLGIGGLIRAYGGSASRCLNNAVIEEEVPVRNLRIRVVFDHVGHLHQLMDQYEATKLSERFDETGVEINAEIIETDAAAFSRALSEITRGQARIRRLSDPVF